MDRSCRRVLTLHDQDRREISRNDGVALLLLALSLFLHHVLATPSAPNTVTLTSTGTMMVDGQPFKINGLAYSIVPIGESERTGNKGDYFTPEYAYMWMRDLPRIKAMGANTIRVYSWNPTVDHTPFLDVCHSLGLKVFITHNIGYARDNPIRTPDQSQSIIDQFVSEVKLLGDHPAILMWSFGNELNGYWLGFLDDLNIRYQCNWNSRQPFDNDGCMGSRTDACMAAKDCLYPNFFGWIDEAIRQAKQFSTRPFTATMADIDNIVSDQPATDLIPRYNPWMKHFDAYAFQLYRGHTFGAYFNQYTAEAAGKPLIVAEYGLDAQNDPCGWPENYDTMRPCSVWSPGLNGQPGGPDAPSDISTYQGCADKTLACAQPGEVSQAQWDTDLTRELLGSPICLGGFLFEWEDEPWKNVETQDFCASPCPVDQLAECSDPTTALGAQYVQGGAAGCTYKAHLSCGDPDPAVVDNCGYFLWGAPDNYVNEGWFGLNGVQDCGDHVGATHHLTVLKARQVVQSLTTLWGGAGNAPPPQTCDQIRPCYRCATTKTRDQIVNGECNSVCAGLQFPYSSAVGVSSSTGSAHTRGGASSSTGALSSGIQTITIGSQGIHIDGQLFKVKGIAYSPVPIGESVNFPPFGDYFTADYVYIWSRDLPALQAMGVNTLRLYSWNATADHRPFLDACQQFNLKILVTHYVPPVDSTLNPANTPAKRDAIIASFANDVQSIGDHPAILAWSFGNELNGAWNGYKGVFDQAGNCNWVSQSCDYLQVDPTHPCFTATTCMYTGLFTWLNQAMVEAKKHTTRLLTSTFADVDYLVSGNLRQDRIPRFDSLLPAMDMYAIQLYRGHTFGAFFSDFVQATQKPLLVGEYGTDAYNDPCGWPENEGQPCFNYYGQPGGEGGSEEAGDFQGCNAVDPNDPCHFPGVVTQALWDKDLTNEIQNSGGVVGGVLIEWHDEYWKNTAVQDFCLEKTTGDQQQVPCPIAHLAECADPTDPWHALFTFGTQPAQLCTPKAHISCGDWNTSFHDICGLQLYAAPDRYVNEAWFGVNGVEDCGDEFSDSDGGHRLSQLSPRRAATEIASVYGGSASTALTTPKTCQAMKACYDCARANSDPRTHEASGVVAGECDTVCGIVFSSGQLNNPSTTGSTTSGGSLIVPGDTSTGGASIFDGSSAFPSESPDLLFVALTAAALILQL